MKYEQSHLSHSLLRDFSPKMPVYTGTDSLSLFLLQADTVALKTYDRCSTH